MHMRALRATSILRSRLALPATAALRPAVTTASLWRRPQLTRRWNSTAPKAAAPTANAAAVPTPSPAPKSASVASPAAAAPEPTAPLMRRKYELTHAPAPAAATGAAVMGGVMSRPSIATNGDYALPHPIWSPEFLETVSVTHQKPQTFVDAAALWTIKAIRFNFDLMSGFSLTSKRTERLWLSRIIFLETVAAIPGSIAASLRHLASLRRMTRDHGWIHSLLEEAENERIHLLTAIALRHPGPVFRATITITQGIFWNFYWCAYALSPRFCHRLVGYLEEEAVKTYTTLLKEMDGGKVFAGVAAPPVAIGYWRLPADASFRTVIANIRADESHHRDVNHQFADLTHRSQNDPTPLNLQRYPNPFPPGH